VYAAWYLLSSLEGPPCSFHHLLCSDQLLDLPHDLGNQIHDQLLDVRISCIQQLQVLCLIVQNEDICGLEINKMLLTYFKDHVLKCHRVNAAVPTLRSDT